jgi:hypothetical protein
MPILSAYAVTDYYAQGMSFPADEPWVLHLNPPPDGPIKRASILVMLSRFSVWSKVRLIQPLWKTKAERLQVIMRFAEAMELEDGLHADLERLDALAAVTTARDGTINDDLLQA